jgi:hypothetical protein
MADGEHDRPDQRITGWAITMSQSAIAIAVAYSQLQFKLNVDMITREISQADKRTFC